MISVYDYLGHAGGPELCKQIASYARTIKAITSQRHVENPKYKGLVYLYEKAFLDKFFKIQTTMKLS